MHYVDFTLTDSSTERDLQGALLKAVHRLNASLDGGQRVSVAFPGWRDPEFSSGRCIKEGSMGHVVRVFGTPEQLIEVGTDDFVMRGMRCAVLTESDAKEVPSNTGWVRFVRDRSKDRRTTPSTLRRRERRAQARGETVAPGPLPRKASERAYMSVSCESTSTGQEFEFRIALDTAQAASGWAAEFSSYGLAKGEGGVPAF